MHAVAGFYQIKYFSNILIWFIAKEISKQGTTVEQIINNNNNKQQ